MLLNITTGYNDSSLFGFTKFKHRSPGQFECDGAKIFLEKHGVYEVVDKKHKIAEACLKKTFLEIGLVGDLRLTNGSKIIVSNKLSHKQIEVNFHDGLRICVLLDKYNGGKLYKDDNFEISMPKFVNVHTEKKEVAVISISCCENRIYESKILGILICSHYFDYVFCKFKLLSNIF